MSEGKLFVFVPSGDFRRRLGSNSSKSESDSDSEEEKPMARKGLVRTGVPVECFRWGFLNLLTFM